MNSARQSDTRVLEQSEDGVKARGLAEEIKRLPYSHNEQRRFAHILLPMIIETLWPAPVEDENDDTQSTEKTTDEATK